MYVGMNAHGSAGPSLAIAIAASLLLASAAAHAQPRPRPLPRPEAEFPEPFSAISGLRELRDGRVLVADSRDKTLQLLDFARGTATPVGRAGAGPGEWSFPSSLYPLTGDSTLMVDAGNNRYFLIAPNGTGTTTAPIPDDASIFRSDLVGIDDAGRMLLVADRRPRRPTDGSVGVGDVLRYDRRRARVDTVARLAQPEGEQTAARMLPGGMMQMVTNLPFAARDLAAIAPDGRIAVVRAAPYRVEWIAPDGTRLVGPEAPSPDIRVTKAEQEAFAKSQVRPGAILVRGPTGAAPARASAPAGSPASAAPPRRRSLPKVSPADVEAIFNPSMTWPAVKPPFLSGAVHMAPDGRVWVLRTRAHDDSIPTYDVFDASGRVADRVALPTGTRLVALGRGTAYLARTDEDDLLWLQRVRTP